MPCYEVKSAKKSRFFDLFHNITTCEFLLVLYFWGSVLLRPLLQASSNSSQILLVFTGAILLLSFNDVMKRPILEKKYLLFLMLLTLIIIFDNLFRRNSYSSQMIQDFILCALIPIWLVSRVKNWIIVLDYFSIISVIAFVRYFIDPFMGYAVFKQDMTFGFDYAAPAAIGLFLGAKRFKSNILKILFWVDVIEIAFFANRSSLISIFLLLIIYNFLVDKNKIGIKFLVITVLCIIGLYNFRSIISSAAAILTKFGYESYAIDSYIQAIESNSVSILFHGRLQIWQDAIEMFNKSPLIGNGTGCFLDAYNTYVHNLFLDLLVQYGIIGMMFFIYLIVKAIIKIFTVRNDLLLPGVLFFCIWFPKLIFSQYFFEDKAIWIFVSFAFVELNHNMKNSDGDCIDE